MRALVIRTAELELPRQRRRVGGDVYGDAAVAVCAGEDAAARQAVDLVAAGEDEPGRGRALDAGLSEGERSVAGDDAPRVRLAVAPGAAWLDGAVLRDADDLHNGSEAVERSTRGQDQLEDAEVGEAVRD